MRFRFTRSAALAFLVCAAIAVPAETDPARLQITETSDAFELNVPVSKLIMSIPKAGLSPQKNSQGGGAASPRYFYFVDSSRNLIISGWFEPASAFKGIKEFWANETAAWKQHGLPEAKNVDFQKINGWDAIIYDIEMPETLSKGHNSHVRAHWVQAGTWIDVHISLTAERSNEELRKSAIDLLRALQVKEKN